jgi:hypothetical protein
MKDLAEGGIEIVISIDYDYISLTPRVIFHEPSRANISSLPFCCYHL